MKKEKNPYYYYFQIEYILKQNKIENKTFIHSNHLPLILSF